MNKKNKCKKFNNSEKKLLWLIYKQYESGSENGG